MKSQNPTLLFLCETLVTGEMIKNISNSFDFSDFFVMEKVGRRGGLTVLWRSTFTCRVQNSSLNHVDLHIMENTAPAWGLTCYYGFPRKRT